jgi:hypothetical protein
MLEQLAMDLGDYLELSYEVVHKTGEAINPGETFTVRFTVRYSATDRVRPIFTRVGLSLEGTAWAEPVRAPSIHLDFPNADVPMHTWDDRRHLDIPMKAKATMPFDLPEAIVQVRIRARCVGFDLLSDPLTVLVEIAPDSTRKGAPPSKPRRPVRLRRSDAVKGASGPPSKS